LREVNEMRMVTGRTVAARLPFDVERELKERAKRLGVRTSVAVQDAVLDWIESADRAFGETRPNPATPDRVAGWWAAKGVDVERGVRRRFAEYSARAAAPKAPNKPQT
jgi:hypothetical protein